LVTGAVGLIGSKFVSRLSSSGHEVVKFDIVASACGTPMDIRNGTLLAEAMSGCTGVVHLAAVSRVVWGEQDPSLCQAVNVEGTRNVLETASDMGSRSPWVLVASSREVYGNARDLPVNEAAPLRPLNVYARSKVEAEKLVIRAVEGGLRASVLRFANVYGEDRDHLDRVAPAFARLAAHGETLRVDGANTTLDFTHIDDVAFGVHRAVNLLSAGEGPWAPIHFVSGYGTTLLELAQIAIRASGAGTIRIAPARTFDVAEFIGDPSRAESILGWRASTALEDGIHRLVNVYRSLSVK
jgi:nucleoside-diphosphate-sugar epimerase